jgi:glycosyltransferase involved in cell wall biosynthesis
MSNPKLLWHSNAPWAPTGYGAQTALFVPKLAEHYDLAVSSFYGLEGAPIVWQGVPILPGLGGTYGNESLPAHVESVFGHPREGLVVSLIDVWVLNPNQCAAFNMACWVPIDHEPAPPGVLKFFLNSHAVPLAMSKFGAEQLSALDPIYVPHGVDTEVYRPVAKSEAREKLGIEDDGFLVGVVAANKGNSPSRKSFVALLEAFAVFRERRPNAKLYLYTDLRGEWSQGVPLGPVIQALGIPEESIGAADPYSIHFHPSSANTMAHLYSAMDVLLNPAMGEGFGVPILEAQACGTPAIVTDFSAMREVCGAGWRVGGARFWTSQQSWQCLPEVADIVAGLESCYRMTPAQREQLAGQAREHALKYDADLVLRDHLLPALEEVRERFADRAPVELVAA